MSALAELDAPPTIEPIVNYLVNDGVEIFNYTGGPGSTEVKSGGTLDPHKVTMHNARPHLAEFKLDVHGFRYARHDTTMTELHGRRRDQARLLPGDGRAGQSRERRQACRGVRPYAAHRRRRRPRGAQDPRAGAPRPQRLHRVVGPAAGARYPAGRGGGAAEAPLRHHPDLAADPLSGRDASARHRRRPLGVVRRLHSFRSAAIPTGSARPTPSPTTRSTSGTGCRARRARRRWCSRSTTRRRTAAPAGPPTPPSTIPPRRRTHAPAKASKSARWRFSDRVLSISRST